MIALVNYGLGNIQAFANIYRRLNVPVIVADTPDLLSLGDKIVLPGVGSFDWAMSRLDKSGMRARLDELVLTQQRPVLGICVGMQMMASRSEEGKLPGLEWIAGEVNKFDETAIAQQTRFPHMGWNDVLPKRTDSIFKGMESPRFYFLHSYHFSAKNPEDVLAMTDYGGQFVSCIRSRNMFGAQFHPEKSHQWGIQLLKNFAEL